MRILGSDLPVVSSDKLKEWCRELGLEANDGILYLYVRTKDGSDSLTFRCRGGMCKLTDMSLGTSRGYIRVDYSDIIDAEEFMDKQVDNFRKIRTLLDWYKGLKY